MLAQRVVDAQPIPRRAELREPASTIAENSSQLLAGHDRARRLERGDELPLRRRLQRLDQRARCAQSVREEGASTSGWRSRVKFMKSGDAGSTALASARRASAAYCPRAVPLCRAIRRHVEPGREACDQPAKRLEMRHAARLAPLVSSTGIRALSVRFARLLRTGQRGAGNRDPAGAIRLSGGLHGTSRIRGRGWCV